MSSSGDHEVSIQSGFYTEDGHRLNFKDMEAYFKDSGNKGKKLLPHPPLVPYHNQVSNNIGVELYWLRYMRATVPQLPRSVSLLFGSSKFIQ
jgi:hypothetical protein